MEPAPETLAGISVDAVREQLKQLGHDDVSDEVIREFLKQLSADAAFIETPAVAFASQDTQSTSSRPGGRNARLYLPRKRVPRRR